MYTLSTNVQIRTSFFVFALTLFLGFGLVAFASSVDDIAYPVSELGGCANGGECRAYCDDSAHINECLGFAERHNLMRTEDLRHARQFAEIGGERPGGCTSPQECRAYCDDIAHMDECLEFAERHGFVEAEELQEARKVQQALRGGAELPGGCRNKDECEAYCEDPANMEQCIAFAEAAGFMKPDELQEARKVLKAVRAGHKPPPCRGQRACDRYCSQPENFEQCITFGEAAGLIPPGELKQARQALQAIQKGARPPKCRGEEECRVYCEEPEHAEECVDFALAAGFMTEQEAAMMRKTGGRGPGGCRGERECNAFCENPENEGVCFAFAQEHGLILEEDLQRMEEGRQGLLRVLQEMPEGVRTCFAERVGGEGVIAQIQGGERRPSREMGDVIQRCFEELDPAFFGPGGPGGGEFEPRSTEGDFGPGGEHGGPGSGGDFGPRPDDILEGVPPGARECVKRALGPDGNASDANGIGEAVRNCMQGSFGPNGGFPRPEHEPDFEAFRPEARGGEGPSPFAPFRGEQEGGRGDLRPEGVHEEGFSGPADIQVEIERRTQGEIQRRTEEGFRRREAEVRDRTQSQIRDGFRSGGVPEEPFGPPSGALEGFRPSEGDFRLLDGGHEPPAGGEGALPSPDDGRERTGANLLRIIQDVFFVLGAE